MIKICFLLQILMITFKLVKSQDDSCYYPNGLAKRCSPPFINAAYKRTVTATNTCGVQRRSDYCVQTHFQYEYGETRPEKCDVCDDTQSSKSHRPELMTDPHIQDSPTWWQSDSMEYPDTQYPNSINITLHLGKSFDITYIQLRFHSSRPDSFVIYKRTNETSEWIPYQYYSSNCEQIYNVSRDEVITKENEAIALCTDEYSDIAPLSGGSIVFSTLEARPSAFEFTESEVLKEWVTATDIRITLNRLNTFGDEVFGDPKVLRSYYYAISDIAVGGSCKCNGHASHCTTFQDSDLEEKYRCECEHNTDGHDCEKCAPFFNDRPWAPATFTDANECLPCDCNGLSDKCVFNQTLYDLTGHGGHCIDCRLNTEGPHCETCKFSFYRNELDQCVSCSCNQEGSVSLQCDPTGRCKCKPGVTGEKCDRCASNYYDLTNEGCKPCTCNKVGSLDTPPVCSVKDGKCRCKQNVEGRDCDKCKPGYFNLDNQVESGCLACFCYGHTSDCHSSSNYISQLIESNLSTELNNDLQNWTATDSFGVKVYTGMKNMSGIYVFASVQDAWFNAPEKYLGNRLTSYNQDLSFNLTFMYRQSSYNKKDIIIENSNSRLQVHQSFYDRLDLTEITSLNEPITKVFKFKLIEKAGWLPHLTAKDFHALLSNITSIKIKASVGDYTFLNNFKLHSAVKSSNKKLSNESASWVEECKCPEGHMGQFCEKCQPGFKRARQFGGPFTKCVPCACNNHSNECDPDTGKCLCQHHTTGDYCERCKDSYYGDALQGTSTDCKKCMCPNDGSCAEIFNFQSNQPEVVCLNCPQGTRGNLCDMCDDGYYEDAELIDNNNNLVCKKCECNANIDEDAVGNCDTKTGQCLRCIYNTTGDSCEKCLNSYWGNALTSLKCHACECSSLGSLASECDLDNGQCMCKKNVIGRQCNQCKDTYWNLKSGEGCTECKCNPLGSVSLSCDQNNGTCSCRAGVTGVKCDQCLPNHYGFSGDGCQHCNCDPYGSLSQQCDIFGKCKCKENIGGTKCDRCIENFQNFTIGCTKCPQCYDLVQQEVNGLRENLTNLYNSLDKIILNTKSSENEQQNKELELKLNSLKTDINLVHRKLFENQDEFDLFKPNYDRTIKSLNDTLESMSIDYKKLQKPIDLFKIKLNELIEVNNRFNKTLQELLQVSPRINELEKDLNASKIVIEEELANSIGSNVELQNKFKGFAFTCRKAANEHISMAKDFSNKVNENIRQSKASLNELKNLITYTSNLKQVSFEINYSGLSKQADKLKNDAEQTQIKLSQTYLELEKSIDELSTLNIDEQSYNKSMEKTAEKINDFNLIIKNTKKEIDELNSKFNGSIKEYEKNVNYARKAIEEIEFKDRTISELLKQSDISKNETAKAFDSAYDAFQMAHNISDTLKDFNNIYETNKVKAEKAAALKPEILANMEQSSELFSKIKQDMKTCKHNILNSTNLLENVNNSLAKNDKNFDEIGQIYSNLKNKTTGLTNKVSVLNSKYTNEREAIQSSLKIYKDLAGNLADQTKNATKIFGRAQNLLNRLDTAQEDLIELENQNITFDGITKEELNRLLVKFEETLNELNSFEQLDTIINDLNERQERNQDKIKFYEREIPELKKSINDLNNIRNNIYMVKCPFNKDPLQPALFK